MKCPESEKYLQQFMDGAISFSSNEWEQHLSSCSPCRENWHAAHVLMDGLQRQTKPVPPADLKQRVIQRILDDKTTAIRPRRRMLRYSIAVLATAACALLVLFVRQQWFSEDNSNRQAVVPKKTKAPPSIEKSVRKATTAVTALGGQLASETKKQAQLLWSLTPNLDVAALPKISPLAKQHENTLVPAADSLRHTTNGVTEGIAIVSNTTKQAVSYFLRDLPSFAGSGSSIKNN